MAIPRPGTHFVTSVTWSRRRTFQHSANAELFLQTLQHYRHEGHYKLHAFVVMPDHIHLLLTPQLLALERVMMLIKGGFLIVFTRRFRYGRRASLITEPQRLKAPCPIMPLAARLKPYPSLGLIRTTIAALIPLVQP